MGRPKIIDQKEYAEIFGIIVHSGNKPITTPEIRDQLGGKISAENLKNKLNTLRNTLHYGTIIHEEKGKGRNPSKFVMRGFSNSSYGEYVRAIPQELYPQLTLRKIWDSHAVTSYALNPKDYDLASSIMTPFLRKHLELGEKKVLPALVRIAVKVMLKSSS